MKPFLSFHLILFISLSESVFAQPRNIDSLRLLLQATGQDSNRVNLLISISTSQSFSDREDMFSSANEALALAKKINFDNGQVRALSIISFYYEHSLGNMAMTLNALLEAKKIYEKQGNEGKVASMNNRIGRAYFEQGDTNEAQTFFAQSYAIWRKLEYKPGLSLVCENLGDVAKANQNWSLALEHYQRSLLYAKEMDDIPTRPIRMSGALRAIGSVYIHRQEYSLALKYEQDALEMALKSGNSIMQIRAYNTMSELYLSQNQPKLALQMADNGYKLLLTKVESKIDIVQSYKRFYNAYEALGDYKRAFNFQQLYSTLSDSLTNAANLVAMERLKSKYELEKKDNKIIQLTQQQVLAASKRNTLIIAFVGVMSIILLLFNRHRIIIGKRLALKKQLLDVYILTLKEKSDAFEKIQIELDAIKLSQPEVDVHLFKLNEILKANILTDDDWQNFKRAFEDIYPGFFVKLRDLYPSITTAELRIASLIKLNLSSKEMGAMLAISSDSVKTARYRLKRRLNLPENESIEEFINKLSISKSRTVEIE
ncbi:tetratricopeptide repeat protein [Chryseolinea soli]|uniref:Uncharacterized protein n=1 Tax=Chryseolinea soli TaxID=2321403 RepID=A0A385SJW4_9BACT|nr:tetratricopeptide repeat protein [Chryseolinea soli]AYB32043.1 hypothetical protein D4L85_16355 [Chryseolinea soli]